MNGHNYISKIEITNIKGIEHLVYDAGMFNDITGDNETGKTSFNDAIAWAFRSKNSHNPRMLRNGCSEGTVKITFKDGNVLTSKVTPEKSFLDFTNQKNAARYIQDITDVFALNPQSFVVAKKEDRVKILTGILPLNMDWQKLEEILQTKVPPTDDPVSVIDYWHERIYKDRTTQNTLADGCESTVADLIRSIPAEDPEEPTELISKLEAEKKSLEDGKEKSRSDAESIKNRMIREAETIRAGAIELANAEYEHALKTANAKYENSVDIMQDEYVAAVSPIDTKLGEAREFLRNFDQIKATRRIIESKKKEGEDLRAESRGMTEMLEGLKALKRDLLSALPFGGIDIREGEVYINNVPFDECADSQQKDFVLMLAKEAARETVLPLVRIDKMESVNSKRMQKFREDAIKTGTQHFISRVVENEPLKITAYN